GSSGRLSLIESFLDRQKIAPCKALLQRAAQQKRRMESRHGANFALAGVETEPASARLGDAVLYAEQRLCRRSAEANQDVGIGGLDLTLDKRQTDLRLLRSWCAIARGPPRYDVRDVNRRSVQAQRRQHAVKQFTGAADERQALDILVASGRFAHKHQARL